MLPDPVTVTVQLTPGENPAEWVTGLHEREPADPPEMGWQMIDVLPGLRSDPAWPGVRVRVRRTDGRYRSRDDSMQGY